MAIRPMPMALEGPKFPKSKKKIHPKPPFLAKVMAI